MEAIQAMQGLAGSIYMITIAIVGVKLLLLWRRTKERPELYLAGSLLIGGVFGAVLEAVGLSLRGLGESPATGPLLLAGKLFGTLGILFQGLFIQRVFRPGKQWAIGLVTVIMAAVYISIVGFAMSGTFATGALPFGWVAVEFVARISGPIWLVVEGTIYYGIMKKRVALGLADPVVANRFALWASAGGFGIVVLLTSLPPIFLDATKWVLVLHADLMLFTVGGVGSATFYALTFFPPAAYKRWIVARAARS